MNMSYRWAILSLGLLAGSVAESANKVVTVSQVTSDVVIADDVDYHITDNAPFSMTGSINITAVDHAVVVFDNVKPSRLLALLPHVRINGQEAVNNKTCQVKIYNQGAMILHTAATSGRSLFTAARISLARRSMTSGSRAAVAS